MTVDASPAAAREEQHRGPSLSPSRAADFKSCPLLYRFRSIDRLPERPNADAVRGTLVHAVLERLFDLPAAERTPESAAALVAPSWAALREERVEVGELFAGGDAAGELSEEEFIAGATELLGGYFAVEDPRRLEPAEREILVETTLGDGLLLRGIVDRLDVAPDGAIRVVDYKSGGAPREAFEARALFQLKFYALVLWRTRGVVPRVLRLLYLKDEEACDYTPDSEELERFERTLVALWDAIERATRAKDFRPRPSKLCGWCSHQALCPEFGGTPPPFPAVPHDSLPQGVGEKVLTGGDEPVAAG
ncbi:exonuclease RecB [Virgisporangium aliadipatigenens]|uniref:Exonuclease RecB n=1 Tax=Virgisporangium aliadipatigenens TaxID=741659 RepID=A0A8J3YMH2_9ACTN|nr:PD-(D/E)XK nuclease family protein [Virgisporangium aliadipatigenens]GIJ46640.1 exonuclease RecB [Virgisporangium aliadipatigenens]